LKHPTAIIQVVVVGGNEQSSGTCIVVKQENIKKVRMQARSNVRLKSVSGIEGYNEDTITGGDLLRIVPL
jgi:hypothetical protein